MLIFTTQLQKISCEGRYIYLSLHLKTSVQHLLGGLNMRHEVFAPLGMDRQEKPYEELGLRNYFIFGKVMKDKNLCIQMLECLIPHLKKAMSFLYVHLTHLNEEEAAIIFLMSVTMTRS